MNWIPNRRQVLVTLIGLACLAQIILTVVARLDQNRIDDDAYMLVRSARNTLHHGAISWNPQEAPTYGLTSLGYFALVLTLETALRVDAAWVLVLATLLCGGLFVVLALLMVRLTTHTATATQRSAATIGVLLALAWGSEGLASHFVNGMDAAFAMLMLVIYLILAHTWFREPGPARALVMGAVGGLLLWVRPDILVFAFLPPIAVFLWPPSRLHRVAAFQVLATTIVVCTGLALVAWAYFGSPVPLPAWSKVIRGYGPDMQEVYARFPAEQLLIFLRHHAVVLTLAALGIALLLAKRGIARVSLELGVWLAAIAFVVFHRFFVLAIMGSHQRFYYPLLPAALFLSIQVIVCLAQTQPLQRCEQRLSRSTVLSRTSVGLALLLVVASLAPGAWSALESISARPLFQHFTVADNYRNNWPSEYWIQLDAFSRLPDDLVIATTEVGYPGVLNPEKTIVDLAGLNDTEFARQGFSARSLFDRYQPDLFLLPRSHYAAMRNELSQAPEFRSGYEIFRPGKGLGIALRRDSPYYRAMRSVLGLP